ncbi:uncharacterized protein DEA37_0007839 [Paragonimus westermani]|uniref:Reverse transcriptase/retrotransposon-derived protein RNase H-like domain-containing protein n=1 Tax=Paragonimus westermani TaxID=34504 RepID=A0A5J4P0G2_9TREM|nr:uncharacterized protein DEA37_0007839 [Paragonimus westermani]
MIPPTDVTTLQSHLGMINYYNSFVSDTHMHRTPSNNLLLCNSQWNWMPEFRNAFDSIRSISSSPLLLTDYDPSFDIIAATDESKYGIAAVILHRF